MSRYDLSRAELSELLADQPSYRANQLWDGLYRRWCEPDELTELPRALREQLTADVRLASALEIAHESATPPSPIIESATTKWLFRLSDGAQIETVLMHRATRSTVCISSQAGCAMACTFCATGDAGFDRQLSTGEILEQVVRAARASAAHGRRLDHVVYMGMGEPFSNLANVGPSIERVIDDIGIAARHVTISTVGIVPGIRWITEFTRQVNLAVSLHGANDQLRNELVPINRRYPLDMLVDACADYVNHTHRRLTFEWAMIEETNDTERDAQELAVIALPLGAHVNLIPLNPTLGGLSRGLRGSTLPHVQAFAHTLRRLGVNVTVRRTQGRAINAACGQLAGSHPHSPTAEELALHAPRRRDIRRAGATPLVRP